MLVYFKHFVLIIIFLGDIFMKKFLYLVENYYENIEWFKTLIFILRFFTTLGTIITVFSLVLYGIGYCFLYGYYFSGNLENITYVLELIPNIVPFNFYSIMYVSTFLLFNIIILFWIFNGMRKHKTIFNILFYICFFLIYHILLTIFFVDSLFGKKLIEFLFIWFIPFFFVLFLIWSIKTIYNPITSILGCIFGIEIIILLVEILADRKFIILVKILIFFIPFIIGILFTILAEKMDRFFIFRFILALPLLYIVLNLLLSITDNFPTVFFIGISISIFIYKFINNVYIRFNHFYDKTTSQNIKNNNECGQSPSTIRRIIIFYDKLSNLNRDTLISIICLLTITIMVALPTAAIYGGKYIRYLTPKDSFKFETIQISDNPKNVITGIIVTEKNGTLFISNKDWELIKLKSNYFSTLKKK